MDREDALPVDVLLVVHLYRVVGNIRSTMEIVFAEMSGEQSDIDETMLVAGDYVATQLKGWKILRFELR